MLQAQAEAPGKLCVWKSEMWVAARLGKLPGSPIDI